MRLREAASRYFAAFECPYSSVLPKFNLRFTSDVRAASVERG